MLAHSLDVVIPDNTPVLLHPAEVDGRLDYTSRRCVNFVEYQVILESLEVDDEGIPNAERVVAVKFDPGIPHDWDEWLECFCEIEGERFRLLSVTPYVEIPFDPDNDEF